MLFGGGGNVLRHGRRGSVLRNGKRGNAPWIRRRRHVLRDRRGPRRNRQTPASHRLSPRVAVGLPSQSSRDTDKKNQQEADEGGRDQLGKPRSRAPHDQSRCGFMPRRLGRRSRITGAVVLRSRGWLPRGNLAHFRRAVRPGHRRIGILGRRLRRIDILGRSRRRHGGILGHRPRSAGILGGRRRRGGILGCRRRRGGILGYRRRHVGILSHSDNSLSLFFAIAVFCGFVTDHNRSMARFSCGVRSVSL
jgi:hypothetical protein